MASSAWLVETDNGEYSDSKEQHHVFSSAQKAKEYCEEVSALEVATKRIRWTECPEFSLGETSHTYIYKGKTERIEVRFFITELPYD